MSMQKRMYVLARKDLDAVYGGVQAGHALAAYSLKGDKGLFKEWGNSDLIYLGVPNENVLKLWTQKLTKMKKVWVGFHEPDLQNQLTAVACISTGDTFKNLRCLRIQK